MIFWLGCSVMALVVFAMIVAPVLRPAAAPDENPDIAVYRAQLDEIERDLERDLLAPDEAERARTEVARRLLAANKAKTTTNTAGGAGYVLPAVIGTGLLGLSFYLYQSIGWR